MQKNDVSQYHDASKEPTNVLTHPLKKGVHCGYSTNLHESHCQGQRKVEISASFLILSWSFLLIQSENFSFNF